MRVPGSDRIQTLSCQTRAERNQRPLLTSLIAGWLPNQKPRGIQSMFQFMAIHLPTPPDSQPSNTWLKGGGLPCGCVCDVPRPVALRLVFPYSSKPAQGSTVSLANSVPRAGIGVVTYRIDSGGSRFSNPRLKLKKSAARIGDAGTTGRLTSSEVLVLASSNTMPPEPFFSHALSLLLCLSDVSLPLRHSSAGWCLPMSVAWRTFRPSIETKLTSSLPPLQLQDSSDHTAHVTKRAFALPSRADCRFAEDRRRSPNCTIASSSRGQEW